MTIRKLTWSFEPEILFQKKIQFHHLLRTNVRNTFKEENENGVKDSQDKEILEGLRIVLPNNRCLINI